MAASPNESQNCKSVNQGHNFFLDAKNIHSHAHTAQTSTWLVVFVVPVGSDHVC